MSRGSSRMTCVDAMRARHARRWTFASATTGRTAFRKTSTSLARPAPRACVLRGDRDDDAIGARSASEQGLRAATDGMMVLRGTIRT